MNMMKQSLFMILLLSLSSSTTAKHGELALDVELGGNSDNGSEKIVNQRRVWGAENDPRWGVGPPEGDTPPEPSPTEPPTQSPTSRVTESPIEPPTESPTPGVTEATPEVTDPPTTSPTPGATDPPTESPTARVTNEPTASPTASPTDPPTVSPTASPTASPTVSPTEQPSAAPSEHPSAAPTTYPMQKIEAAGIVMSLMGVEPLDEEAEENWTNITEAHLADEIWNTVNPLSVDVKVELVAQDPPFIARGLRRLQTTSAQQKVTFNAYYSIEAEMQIADINIFLTGAFVSEFKREIYMDSLKQSGDTVFQNLSMVLVEPATTTAPIDDNDKNGNGVGNTAGEKDSPFGTIIGVVVVILVVLILGLACYMRCRRRGPRVPKHSKGDEANGKDIVSDQSRTSDESIETPRAKDSQSDRSEGTSNASLFNFRPKEQASGETSTGGFLKYLPKPNASSTKSYTLPSFASLWNRGDDQNSNASSFGTSKSNKEDEIICDKITVEVPKGKLGLVLDIKDDGYPTVQVIKPTSPFHGRVQVGDRLHSLDGQDLNMISSETISQIMAWKQNNQTRVFVFDRPSGDK